jgi:hypothetical protein
MRGAVVDPHKLTSAVMRYLNDEIAVREYGHGFLVALPLAYWDDDCVTLFVEPFEDGFKITDQGATAVRLHMTGMNPQAPKVAESWARSIASLNLYNPSEEDLELAHFTAHDDLGEAIVKVAEASLRVDQLRWLHSAQTPVRFPDRVIKRLSAAVGERGDVRPYASLRLRHGRERQVTAAVQARPDHEVFVQAVGGSTKDAKERAVEHCTFLFNQAADLPQGQRLAVASGHREDWDDYFINTLAEAGAVAFFDEPGDLDEILSRQLARA